MIYNFRPLDPQEEVVSHYDNIRIKNSSLLICLLEAIRLLGTNLQPLHKLQLLNINNKYRDNGYLSKTEFNSLCSIFQRYKEDLLNINTTDEEFLKTIHSIFSEVREFEEKVEKLQESVYQFGAGSNVEIRKRVVK